MATSRLSTRRVDWRVQVGTNNKAAQGLVIFEASVSYIPDPLAAGGPRTAIPEPVPAVLDAAGYACTPDPANPAKAGERGVTLFTTDSLGEDGGHWTWTARPQLRSVNGIQMADAVPAFSFAVPAGDTPLDLSRVQKVPASPGLGTEAAVALVAEAQQAVEDVKKAVLGETLEAVVDMTLADASLARARSYGAAGIDEGFIGDEAGRPSKVGFDNRGEIADATMLSAHQKGMPLTMPGGGGLRFQDMNGKDSWLGWDATGGPDTIAKQALINTLHEYTGPDRPYVWPGNFVVWTRTDHAGNPIETLIGRN